MTADNKDKTINTQLITSKLKEKKNTNIEQQAYYHGILLDKDVESLLQNDGDFAVRRSLQDRNKLKQGETPYVLIVLWKKEPRRFKIPTNDDDEFVFEDRAFATIVELIDYHKRTQVPITKSSGAVLKNEVGKAKWELSKDNIEKNKKIGDGNFGAVYHGLLKQQNGKCDVAIKTYRESTSEEERKIFLSEAHIMRKFNHKNVVRMYGIVATTHPAMIVMEYLAKGCLRDWLRKNNSANHEQLYSFVKDAASGMEYLEQQLCLHRDLAARNCLLNDELVLKIADFGLSREGLQYSYHGVRNLPIKWIAPEVLSGKDYTSKSDVWSFGILSWEIYSYGKEPYLGYPNVEVAEKVKLGFRLPIPNNCPEKIKVLFNGCWKDSPIERPKFSKIVCMLKEGSN